MHDDHIPIRFLTACGPDGRHIVSFTPLAHAYYGEVDAAVELKQHLQHGAVANLTFHALGTYSERTCSVHPYTMPFASVDGRDVVEIPPENTDSIIVTTFSWGIQTWAAERREGRVLGKSSAYTAESLIAEKILKSFERAHHPEGIPENDPLNNNLIYAYHNASGGMLSIEHSYAYCPLLTASMTATRYGIAALHSSAPIVRRDERMKQHLKDSSIRYSQAHFSLSVTYELLL